jgi:(3R)-3-hydroxyacyl-CoA dehydrogenase / 3a,7a,12a-trihydroxy-5b-cholest-24-enoyl-CoA hydratase / enoyl-CoA hydratase 2
MDSLFILRLDEAMLDRQSLVGKTFESFTYTVTQQAAWAYARATNDLNPRYESGLMAPPMFAVVLEMPAMLRAIKDPDVVGDGERYARLLHGEHDLRFHGKLVPGRVYDTHVSIAAVTQKGDNEIIELRLLTVDKQRNEAVVESVAQMFIRGTAAHEKKAPGDARPQKQAEEAKTAPIIDVMSAVEQLDPDQSLRYAEASGDHNPIHLDPALAKSVGLPDIIVHGLCTLAFCQKSLVNHTLSGEPERLKRLKARFAKPVLNGQALRVEAFEVDAAPWSRTLGYTARVGDSLVIKEGIAEITL